MKHKVPDGVEVWKQFEDLLIPGLRLSVMERAVYSHLLRHSRLEGKQRLVLSIRRLARGASLGEGVARRGVRRLAAKGILRLAERSKRGHVIEVRLPEEVRGVRARKIAEGEAERLRGTVNLEETDFLGKRELREAIHAREGGRCFYCLRRVTAATRGIDHIIPRARMGRNGYRNLVSSCAECNSRKGERRRSWRPVSCGRWLVNGRRGGKGSRGSKGGKGNRREACLQAGRLAHGQRRARCIVPLQILIIRIGFLAVFQ